MSGHTPVLGQERTVELAFAAVDAAIRAGATEAEALIMTEDSGLTRYAESRIHQNVAERTVEVRVRAAIGPQVAVAASNQTEAAAVRALGARAAAMAAHSPEDPFYPGLPDPPATPYAEQTTLYPSTAEVEAVDRARAVEAICRLLRRVDTLGFGVVTTAVTELGVANSHGLQAYQAFTDAWVSVIARRDTGLRASTGHATSCHRDWNEVDAEGAALRALAKATLDTPRQVDPGRYTVLLEPPAVAEMMQFLAYTALNGLEVVEGRSPYAGHLGEPRYPSGITLLDDPTDQRGTNMSFDFEGVPKGPTTLIAAGTLQEVAWDRSTAQRAGRATTGHALPAPNPHGPMPLNMLLAPGRHSRADLIGHIERGLLVTRFHYVNEVDPARTLLTGMTRDGTFLIEDGAVTGPVQDLRWVDSVDGVLRRTIAVGDTLQLVSEGPGYDIRMLTGTLMPALLVEGFQITGSAAG